MAAAKIALVVPVYVLLTLLCISEIVFAVDGNWAEWLPWEQCSASCGQGIRKRLRFCNNPAPSRGGASCAGKSIQREDCEALNNCPVDGDWSEWTMWTACSVTCGEGVRSRSRECNSPLPSNGGRDCEGSRSDSMTCISSGHCPRDGKWSSWSRWSSCSVTCGDGSSFRYRECNNPPPSPNGSDCKGDKEQARVCKSHKKCSVNGHWSGWSGWSDCSVTCGSGVRIRWRKCDNPTPQNGGEDCSRTEAGEMQEMSCNGTVVFCAVNGGWSDWGEWGECLSLNCAAQDGLSYIIRQRSCNNPYPSHTGSMCQGTFLSAAMCDIAVNCPINGGWSDWGKWQCKPTHVTRVRKCDNPAPSNGGRICGGSKVETYVDGDIEFEQLCPEFLEKGSANGDQEEEEEGGNADLDEEEEEEGEEDW